MQDLVRFVEASQLKTDLPQIEIGDLLKVHLKVVEGTRERIQVFEGFLIGKKGGGVRETITLRRISYGVGVERVIPLHSPRVEKIEKVRSGKVRRAKLYYLRSRLGKAARVEGRTK